MKQPDFLTRRRFGVVLSAATCLHARQQSITCYSAAENDLYRILHTAKVRIERHAAAGEAIDQATPGSAILLLPAAPLTLAPELIERARKKKLRVFAEYCSWGEVTPQTRTVEWERAVVTGGFFGVDRNQRILSLHHCRYLAATASSHVHMCLARVAGYDRAVFGVPNNASPLLYEPEPGFLIATAVLSNFLTGRYAPSESWTWVWNRILEWLSGPEKLPRWKPRLRPTYSQHEPLPPGAERRAVQRAVSWYSQARLFVHPSWQNKLDEARQYKDRNGPAPRTDWPLGDGKLGVIEGHASEILSDGSQNARWWIRADCIGETAMTLSLANGRSKVAMNLIDYLFGKTRMAKGARVNPESASYGLIGWNEAEKYFKDLDGFDVYYGDDNARCLLGVIASEALNKRTRWQERIWRAVLANFRTSGRLGHRESRHDRQPLAARGWRFYYEQEKTLHDMNYQAYPWALFLWAYSQTGYRPFLNRIEHGIRLTMEAYPSGWRCTNSMTMEQARLLLPLAWLVRVSDTAEHREWLHRMAEELLQQQQPCGAIREWLANVENSIQIPPTANEKYGTGEGTLIQTNGDPAADLLYTVNFALIGLHEAAAVTGDRYYSDAENRLADFVIRCQVRADASLHQFDGAWFRAFDFNKWDYWSSSSDNGWGAWCTETGWSQSWLTSTLALRVRDESLWGIMSRQHISAAPFNQLLKEMIPV